VQDLQHARAVEPDVWAEGKIDGNMLVSFATVGNKNSYRLDRARFTASREEKALRVKDDDMCQGTMTCVQCSVPYPELRSVILAGNRNDHDIQKHSSMRYNWNNRRRSLHFSSFDIGEARPLYNICPTLALECGPYGRRAPTSDSKVPVPHRKHSRRIPIRSRMRYSPCFASGDVGRYALDVARGHVLVG
jgi:hypothetical protein